LIYKKENWKNKLFKYFNEDKKKLKVKIDFFSKLTYVYKIYNVSISINKKKSNQIIIN
jgi:hypothetical protein